MKDSTRLRTYDGVIHLNTDQPMGPPKRPTRKEAFERIKRWLEIHHASSDDEAITNLRAEEIVRLVLDA